MFQNKNSEPASLVVYKIQQSIYHIVYYVMSSGGRQNYAGILAL
jgi:hypothetical protein